MTTTSELVIGAPASGGVGLLRGPASNYHRFRCVVAPRHTLQRTGSCSCCLGQLASLLLSQSEFPPKFANLPQYLQRQQHSSPKKPAGRSETISDTQPQHNRILLASRIPISRAAPCWPPYRRHGAGRQPLPAGVELIFVKHNDGRRRDLGFHKELLFTTQPSGTQL